jgi:CRP-like cAMP-binding protein
VTQPARCEVCRLGRAAAPGRCPFTEQRLEAGACLTLPAGRSDTAWYLREGHVVLSAANASGRELACVVRGPGSLLGLEALEQRPYDFECWTLSDVVLCRVAGSTLRSWVGPPDGPTATILHFALDEARHRAEDRRAVGGSAVVRLARFLAHGLPSEVGGRLKLPSAVLARVLAMRPETLSRALAELRRRGALARGRAVVIAHRARLETIAEE